ncbi:uncharacterized protein LOC132312030 [Cornus florida]|uniref:uncharacterized protein LOC132312030 n=1 Tax=Cornus florida TaxID=4283 RepID=UPI0028A1EA72|nr:uncharacterized protein LOC132312030 [Cornus florida]
MGCEISINWLRMQLVYWLSEKLPYYFREKYNYYREKYNENIGELWFWYGVVSALAGMCCFVNIEGIRNVFERHMNIGSTILPIGMMLHIQIVYEAHARRKFGQNSMYEHQIGCFAKSATCLLHLCALFILSHLVEDIYYGLAWISFTTEYCVFRELLYGYRDFSLWDALLEVLMQIIVISQKDNNIYLKIANLMICGVVVYYRHCSYSPCCNSRSSSQDRRRKMK